MFYAFFSNRTDHLGIVERHIPACTMKKRGNNAWRINDGDQQMAVLLSSTGLFAHSQKENRLGLPVPYRAPPESFFPSEPRPDSLLDHRPLAHVAD